MHFLTHNKPCSRCPRVEATKVTLQEATVMHAAAAPKSPMVAASFRAPNGKVTEYAFDDLCPTCSGIVVAYLESAFKKLQKHSSTRTDEE